MHQSRGYQERMIQENFTAWETVNDVLDVLPTGGGKTFIIAATISRFPGYACVMAHRQELVAQIALALAREGIRHRVLGSGEALRSCIRMQLEELGHHCVDPNAPHAVASVDTLIRMSPNDPFFAQIRLVICDEAHHILRNNKWGKGRAMFPRAKGLGVTATPLRADGRGLGRHADGVFDQMIIGPGMRELIESTPRYLTPYRIFAPKSDLDLSDVPLSASGDFSPPKLAAAVHKSHITGDVVSHYKRIADGKQGITFAVDLEAGKEIMMCYRDAGVPAEIISAKTPNRDDMMRRFRRGQFRQLVSVDVVGEGVDLPAVEVVSFARPTQSYGLYVQQFGRVVRLLAGKEFGIVIDHVGNCIRHGLPDGYRRWTLNARDRATKGKPNDVVPTKTCTNPNSPGAEGVPCLSVYEAVLPACPYCGYKPQPARRDGPEYVDGDLHELDAATLAKLRGDIAQFDSGFVAIPHGAPAAAAYALRAHHRTRQTAQHGLRGAMALWAGWQAHLGRGESESYRRFYAKYGIDAASAAVLPAAEAVALETKLRAELDAHGIIDASDN